MLHNRNMLHNIQVIKSNITFTMGYLLAFIFLKLDSKGKQEEM